jgi:hypothetical protein
MASLFSFVTKEQLSPIESRSTVPRSANYEKSTSNDHNAANYR